MELLQSYDVSLEESDEDAKSSLGCQESDKVNNGKDASNFFGISQDHHSDEDDSESDMQEECCITVKDVTVEVPQSDFWKNMTEDDVKEAQEAKTRLPSAEVVLESNRKSHFEKNKEINHARKHKHKDWNTSPVKTLKVCQSQQQSAVISIRSGNLLKNVFYVHSKIKPAMHSRQNSCPPRVEERYIQGHGGVINRVKWNISSFSHLFLSVSMDTTVKVWNAWSTEEECVRQVNHHTKAVKDAEWNADGRSIISCSYDRTAVLTDVETGKILCKLDHTSYVTCAKFHPVRRSQVVTGSSNSIQQWDIRTPDSVCRQFDFKDDLGQIQDLLFSQDGGQLFSCSDMVTRDSADRNIMAWDYSSTVPLSNQIYQERYACTRLKLHPTTGHFLAQTHGGYIALFSVNWPYKMVRSKRFEGHSLLGYSIGFDLSPDGCHVISGSSDGQVHCYDYQTGKTRYTLDTGLGVCMDVAWHPVLTSTIACCSWSGDVKVFH